MPDTNSIMNNASENILVQCPNWVGDVVMATPTLRAIRENNPRAYIAVLVRPQIRKVLEGLPFFDEVIDYDSTNLHRGWGQKVAISRKLRKRRFSVSFILPNSFSSAMLAWMAGIPARIGYRTDGRRLLLTKAIPPPSDGHHIIPIPMVDRYLALCEHLQYTVSSRATVLGLTEGTVSEMQAILQSRRVQPNQPVVSIIPGASFGSSKCWLPEHFACVGDNLIEKYRAQILIIPGPGEEAIALRIQSLMKQAAIALIDPILSLEQLKAAICRSDLVITNDTGPRHYAVAFGKPVIVIMGPTDPRYTNYGMEKTRLLRVDLACSPCHLKVCPTDHACMKAVTAEQVLQACEEFLLKQDGAHEE